MREKNFFPNRNNKKQAPDRLVSLNGRMRAGGKVNMGKPTKPPKMRFKVGDKFQHDGEQWEVIYAFRVEREPGVWNYCLEVINDTKGPLQDIIIEAGAGSKTPRVVYEPFKSHNDANTYFYDIYAKGSRLITTTQRLLTFKKLEQ